MTRQGIAPHKHYLPDHEIEQRLKPCPFCGAVVWDIVHWPDYLNYQIECSQCDFMFTYECDGCSIDDVIEKWNERAGT